MHCIPTLEISDCLHDYKNNGELARGGALRNFSFLYIAELYPVWLL